MKKIKTVVERFPGIGTWTYATIPFNCEQTFGSKGRIRVVAKIKGYSANAVLMPHGNGKHFIILTKQVRDKAQIKEGDKISIELVKDEKAPETVVPDDLNSALDENVKAKQFFDSLAPSHKKEYINWIEGAKKAETRGKRIIKAISMLSANNKLK
jgi:transcription termination factor Rho